MDYNEIPSDHVVIEEKMDENDNKVADFDNNCNNDLGESGINCGEIVNKCKEEEQKYLALEFRSNNLELEGIRGKIRVLECERVKIDEEVKGLRKKVAVLEGAVGREFSMEERNVGVESDEEMSKVDQLMIENMVLECEKSFALKGVEEWKRKCEELELRVFELEGRLSCDGKNDILTGVKEVSKGGVVNAARNDGSATYSPGGIQSEGTTSMGKHVRRQLAFFNEKSCDQKIAPPTPAGARPSSATVIDFDSDHEPDVPAQQSERSPSGLPEIAVIETDGISDEEDDTVGEGDDPKTPKRKRDLTVYSSDDEAGKNEPMTKRRALKIENSDNEGEDDDDTQPISRLIYRGKSDYAIDAEDNIPISQLKMNSPQGSRRSVRLQEKKSSGQRSHNQSHSLTRPKRRLVKCGQKMKNCPNSLTKKYVDDEESEEDDSESDDSLDSFIVNDSDSEDNEDDLSDDCNHYSPEPQEALDNDLDLGNIMSTIQRCKPKSDWVLVGEMLSDFGKDPELCMRAVCAIYRRQTTDEQICMASLNQNGRGFSKFDATRGTVLGDFLTDGDPNGDVVKTLEELQIYDPKALEVCRSLAYRYSNQLFDIYKNNEDPFFP